MRRGLLRVIGGLRKGVRDYSNNFGLIGCIWGPFPTWGRRSRERRRIEVEVKDFHVEMLPDVVVFGICSL